MLDEILVNTAGERCYRTQIFGEWQYVFDLKSRNWFFCQCVAQPIDEPATDEPEASEPATSAAVHTGAPPAKQQTQTKPSGVLPLSEYDGPRRAHTVSEIPPRIYG